MHTELSVLWSGHKGMDCPHAPAPEGKGVDCFCAEPKEKGRVFFMNRIWKVLRVCSKAESCVFKHRVPEVGMGQKKNRTRLAQVPWERAESA